MKVWPNISNFFIRSNGTTIQTLKNGNKKRFFFYFKIFQNWFQISRIFGHTFIENYFPIEWHLFRLSATKTEGEDAFGGYPLKSHFLSKSRFLCIKSKIFYKRPINFTCFITYPNFKDVGWIIKKKAILGRRSPKSYHNFQIL